MGFIETLGHTERQLPASFHDWVLKTFGSGIANISCFRTTKNSGRWTRGDHFGLGKLVHSETLP